MIHRRGGGTVGSTPLLSAGVDPNRSCPGDFTCQTNQPIRKQIDNQYVLMYFDDLHLLSTAWTR